MESIFLKGILWLFSGFVAMLMATSLRFTRLMVNTTAVGIIASGLVNGLSWHFFAMGVFLLFVSVLSFFIAEDEEE